MSEIRYSRIVEGRFEGNIIRSYCGITEVFRNGKWSDFNILERGMEDGYETELISEKTVEKEIGEKMHIGEDELISGVNEVLESVEGKTSEEIISEAMSLLGENR